MGPQRGPGEQYIVTVVNVLGTATELNRNPGEDTDLGTLIVSPPLSFFLCS